MFSALERGLARSSSIEEFKRWVEALPEPSSETNAFHPEEKSSASARIAGLFAALDEADEGGFAL